MTYAVMPPPAGLLFCDLTSIFLLLDLKDNESVFLRMVIAFYSLGCITKSTVEMIRLNACKCEDYAWLLVKASWLRRQ